MNARYLSDREICYVDHPNRSMHTTWKTMWKGFLEITVKNDLKAWNDFLDVSQPLKKEGK